jgi:Na+-driven multidrug efflux pump
MTINSRTAFAVLLLGQSMNLLIILSRSYIDKFLNPIIAIYTVVAFSTTNILLDIVLIPLYGINGAAVATALSLAVNGAIWFYIYITKILSVHDGSLVNVKNFISEIIFSTARR